MCIGVLMRMHAYAYSSLYMNTDVYECVYVGTYKRAYVYMYVAQTQVYVFMLVCTATVMISPILYIFFICCLYRHICSC